MIKQYGTVGILFFMLPLIVYGQNKRDTTGGLILIDHFGKLIEDKQGIETIKWISQGLQLRIDSTYIYADSAVIYGEDRVHAYNDVVIQQADSLSVFTDTLYYFRIGDVARLNGEVALVQGSRQLWTNNLSYYLSDRFGEYHNGGTLIDGPLQVSSRKGIYWARSEEVMFRDSVVVLHPKFNLIADSMRYLAPAGLVRFTGPTNIYTEAAKIYCEGGFYELNSETAEFNVDPAYEGNGKKATADTIRYNAKTGEVEMLGNVKVKEMDRHIYGTYLQYHEKTGETLIKGYPAVYQDSSRSISSPEIFYNEKTNQLSTKGGGNISFDNFIIQAETFSFDESTGKGQATGNVEWQDTAQDVGIRAGHIDYAKNSGYMLAYGPRRTLFYTIIERDTLFIAADTLNMWNEADPTASIDTIRMMRMYNDVRLFKSDLQGLADSLVFNGRDSIFTFYKSPVMWSDTTQFSGDTIFMQVADKQIRNIFLHRNAMIISEILDVYYDQIKGKDIVAYIDSSRIKEMQVTGNAESIYYTRDDDSAFIGVNKTICSKMYFSFTGGEIHTLKYFGDNSSSLLPMREAKHQELRLEGFHWREKEKPQDLNDLLE